MEKDFKYEVAFTFCHEDESLATQLNDLICDRYKTFIYYEQQKRLAGNDGEIEFKKIFSTEARVVVILYRNKWGETQFTRYERDAIRERGGEQSYDFTLLIPTEKKIILPPWFPKYRLWYLLERYGIEGAASVIESRIQENKGIMKKEDAEEKAKRLQRKILLKEQKRKFLYSKNGVEAAAKEIKILFSILDDIADKSTDKESNLLFTVHKSDDKCSCFNKDFSIQIEWNGLYWNSLSDSYLQVDLTKPMRQPHNPIIYSKYKFQFDVNQADNYGWLSNDNKYFSSESLANYLFKILLDKIEKELP
ncbi:MAG: hypothetical protein IH950_12135 [Bacteroidetes bacterium]|nr:hypothetical protein [Bacteroidota bacterium]